MVPNLKETSENNTSFNQGLFQYRKHFVMERPHHNFLTRALFFTTRFYILLTRDLNFDDSVSYN